MANFIKWAGGKSQLITDELYKYLPSKNDYHFYVEPFLGGGSMFFHLQPENAFLSDTCEDLIIAYLEIRNNPDEVIDYMKKHFTHDKDCYLKVRNADRDPVFPFTSHVFRAARFLYLNRTGFNGLWRVNSKGQNNVSYGTPRGMEYVILEDTFKEVSKILRDTEACIDICDFSRAPMHFTRRVFYYLDPPYLPVSDTSNFANYSGSFDKKDHEELAMYLDELDKRGHIFLLSMSDTEEAHRIYGKYPCKEVTANRSGSGDTKGRGKIKELIFSNYL